MVAVKKNTKYLIRLTIHIRYKNVEEVLNIMVKFQARADLT